MDLNLSIETMFEQDLSDGAAAAMGLQLLWSDTSELTNQVEIGVVLSGAEEEAAIRQDRARAHRERLRAAGRPRIGGRRPYGFESDSVTPRPKEQRLIRRSAATLATKSSTTATIAGCPPSRW